MGHYLILQHSCLMLFVSMFQGTLTPNIGIYTSPWSCLISPVRCFLGVATVLSMCSAFLPWPFGGAHGGLARALWDSWLRQGQRPALGMTCRCFNLCLCHQSVDGEMVGNSRRCQKYDTLGHVILDVSLSTSGPIDCKLESCSGGVRGGGDGL